MEQQKNSAIVSFLKRMAFDKKPMLWQFIIVIVWAIAAFTLTYYLYYINEIDTMVYYGILPVNKDYLIYISVGMTILGFLLLYIIPPLNQNLTKNDHLKEIPQENQSFQAKKVL